MSSSYSDDVCKVISRKLRMTQKEYKKLLQFVLVVLEEKPVLLLDTLLDMYNQLRDIEGKRHISYKKMMRFMLYQNKMQNNAFGFFVENTPGDPPVISFYVMKYKEIEDRDAPILTDGDRVFFKFDGTMAAEMIASLENEYK